MGTALANAVASGGRDCALWSDDVELVREINSNHRHPCHFREYELSHLLSATTNLEQAVAGAQLAIIAARSDGFRDVVRKLGAFAPRELVIVSATKGLEPKTQKRMSELVSEETAVREVAALSGPNITHDIIACRPTGLVVASEASSAVALSVNLIELPTLRVFGSSDIVGVELAGALKNIVAIAMGMAAGLALGDNFRSLLFALGLAEIQRLGSSMGARPGTFTGLAGIGDLFLTATSVHSRNHMVGVELGSGAALADVLDYLDKVSETAEGINTLQACRRLALEHGVAMPLVECMYDVVFQGLDPRKAFERFMDDAFPNRALVAN
jgi:glycerol-3-phosphate dehydrogenase (NAD(P)+)